MATRVETRREIATMLLSSWQQVLRKIAFQVFLFSFIILFLEATLFSTLLFTHTYLIAMQSIAFALLGIGLGALIAAWLDNQTISNWVTWAMLGNIGAVFALFINITAFPNTVPYSPFLILPFIFGSAVISHAFRQGDTGSLYFFDLAGAAAGIILFVVLLPLWRVEGNLIFLALLMAGIAYLQMRPQRKIKRSLLGLQVILLLMLPLSMFTQTLNLSNLISCPSFAPPKKIFCWLDARSDSSHVVVSQGDLAARIDILSLFSPKYGHNRLWVNYNGMMADSISASKLEMNKGDLRIPGNLTPHPDILIIGTAGNGIIRPARLLAGKTGKIDGLEINAGLVSLMTGPLKKASGDVYSYLDHLFITDARTFLNTHNKSYGVITLLNTYTGRLEHSLGAPEYLHTVEAMDSYLAHLTPNGFLIFEIRDVNDLTRAAGLRIINALAEAYSARSGDPQVQDNFYIYEYYPKNQSLVRGNNYTMVIFKNTSLTDAEINYLNSWIDNHNEPGKIPRVNRLHVPGETSVHDYGRFITATPEERLHYFADSAWITAPTTDDRPFLADAKPGFQEVKNVVQRTAVIILIAVLILLISQWRGKPARNVVKIAPFWLYFAATGSGYLLIEVTLIQWLQIFTGLPAYTFIFVLGALLLFSGIGAYISRNWTFRRIAPSFIVLLGLIGSYGFWLQPMMVGLQTPSFFWNAFLAALLLLPLGFFMGIPLPYGLRLLRQQFSDKDVPFGYGLNSLFGTLGSSSAIFIALYAGFNVVFKLGAAAYLFAFLALIIVWLHISKETLFKDKKI